MVIYILGPLFLTIFVIQTLRDIVCQQQAINSFQSALFLAPILAAIDWLSPLSERFHDSNIDFLDNFLVCLVTMLLSLDLGVASFVNSILAQLTKLPFLCAQITPELYERLVLRLMDGKFTKFFEVTSSIAVAVRLLHVAAELAYDQVLKSPVAGIL